jgi:hypothetical protein
VRNKKNYLYLQETFLSILTQKLVSRRALSVGLVEPEDSIDHVITTNLEPSFINPNIKWRTDFRTMGIP